MERDNKQRKGRKTDKAPPLVPVLANNRFLTDILCSFSDRPTEDSNELVSIKPDLNPVVEQAKEGTKRKSCHKDGHKPILDHWVG